MLSVKAFTENNKVLLPILKSAFLQDYGLMENAEISLLKFSENMIFLAQSIPQGQKAVIRVSRPGYHSVDELRSELVWMDEIRRETDINIARIYTGTDRHFLHKITTQLGRTYIYSVQSFINGKTVKSLKGDAFYRQIETIGVIAAKLHLQSEKRGKKRPRLPRFTWDIQDTIGSNARWGNYIQFEHKSKEEADLLRKTADLITKRLFSYGRDSSRYGLIHADLHLENFLAENNKVSLIDFDDCGYGWFLYDLASLVSQYSENLEKMVAAYLKGYEKVRNLTKEDKDEIWTFIILRRLVRLGWLTTRKENGLLDKIGDIYFKMTVSYAKKYLNKYTE